MEQPAATHGSGDKDRQSAIIIYILYLIGFATGVSALAGVILAHAKETDSPVWQSHFTYQIRTFWLGLVMLIVSAILYIILIGWLVAAFWALWTLVRVVKGLLLAMDGKGIDNPETNSW
ncbi:DUF4870 family protein [Kordiimonas gwangyangensis]|uniref:DUF4870 family protein n=1 Tax=Kordiimonas gwangyangensis TaxID=288022 RepID=UPI00192E5926|nr:hypothetical protein [Kordiimonas gwangyangensis]